MDNTRTSKHLSLVLRHAPEIIGIELDSAGWAQVNDLLLALNKSGEPITRSELEHIVATSAKQRFAFSSDRKRIRANQGHSVPVDLDLPAYAPPMHLFHGTTARFWQSIEKTGLHKAKRHHVHLHADRAVARKVGARRGKPIVLEIDTTAMSQAGHVFYRSENGVWLTDKVPPEYLRRLDDSDLPA